MDAYFSKNEAPLGYPRSASGTPKSRIDIYYLFKFFTSRCHFCVFLSRKYIQVEETFALVKLPKLKRPSVLSYHLSFFSLPLMATHMSVYIKDYPRLPFGNGSLRPKNVQKLRGKKPASKIFQLLIMHFWQHLSVAFVLAIAILLQTLFGSFHEKATSFVFTFPLLR